MLQFAEHFVHVRTQLSPHVATFGPFGAAVAVSAVAAPCDR